MPTQYNPFMDGPSQTTDQGLGSQKIGRTTLGGVQGTQEPWRPRNVPQAGPRINVPASQDPQPYNNTAQPTYNPATSSPPMQQFQSPQSLQREVGLAQRPYATANPASYNRRNSGAENQLQSYAPQSMNYAYGDVPQGGGDWLSGWMGNQRGRWNPFQPQFNDRRGAVVQYNHGLTAAQRGIDPAQNDPRNRWMNAQNIGPTGLPIIPEITYGMGNPIATPGPRQWPNGSTDPGGSGGPGGTMPPNIGPTGLPIVPEITWGMGNPIPTAGPRQWENGSTNPRGNYIDQPAYGGPAQKYGKTSIIQDQNPMPQQGWESMFGQRMF